MTIFTSEDYDKFRTLRITKVAEALEELLADESNDRVPPETLFRHAVDDALQARRATRVERLITQASFPFADASIEELDYRDERGGLNPVRMSRYAANDWGNDKVNVGITSMSGTGKTHLACAIGIAACHNERSVKYWRMDALGLALVGVNDDHIAHRNLSRCPLPGWACRS